MKLPRGHEAIVAPEKLRDYCLDPYHKRGMHKARVFEAALGLGRNDWQELQQALLNAAKTEEVQLVKENEYGATFRMRFPVELQDRRANLVALWLKPTNGRPHLITCYVAR